MFKCPAAVRRLFAREVIGASVAIAASLPPSCVTGKSRPKSPARVMRRSATNAPHRPPPIKTSAQNTRQNGKQGLMARCAIIGCTHREPGQGEYICAQCAKFLPRRYRKWMKIANKTKNIELAKRLFKRGVNATIERMAGIA